MNNLETALKALKEKTNRETVKTVLEKFIDYRDEVELDDFELSAIDAVFPPPEPEWKTKLKYIQRKHADVLKDYIPIRTPLENIINGNLTCTLTQLEYLTRDIAEQVMIQLLNYPSPNQPAKRLAALYQALETVRQSL